jgi:hypothetical protein
MNLPGFLNDFKRRLRELVPLGEITACVLELVEAADLTIHRADSSTGATGLPLQQYGTARRVMGACAYINLDRAVAARSTWGRVWERNTRVNVTKPELNPSPSLVETEGIDHRHSPIINRRRQHNSVSAFQAGAQRIDAKPEAMGLSPPQRRCR